MKLKPRKININAGGPLIAVLNAKDAKHLDVDPLDRIEITYGKKKIIAVVDTTDSKNIKSGEIGLFKNLAEKLKKYKSVEVKYSKKPEALLGIKKKLEGKELSNDEIDEIIKSLVNNSLSEIESTYLISACHTHGIDDKEALEFTKAFLRYSKPLGIKKKIILDKHCMGGIAGNRTTMIIIPIIASLGYTIPKTSTRSITSPAGTADAMEVLAPVTFHNREIKKIVNKTNACLVWGGTQELASADDQIIKIEKVLDLDPFLLPSIIGKKKAVGATHVLIDIPMGKEAKITNKKAANDLAKKFIWLGKKIGLKVKIKFTKGESPIGNGIGPALEAIDVLKVLENDGPVDLREKSINLAVDLLKMVNCKNARKRVIKSLEDGLAYKKMQEIIKAQGGNPNITPAKIKLGKFQKVIKATQSGKVVGISNKRISRIAKYAGAPSDKKAGIYLHKKVKERVIKGEPLFTIYSENQDRLDTALQIYRKEKPYSIK
jgi:AMP phosphorylase